MIWAIRALIAPLIVASRVVLSPSDGISPVVCASLSSKTNELIIEPNCGSWL